MLAGARGVGQDCAALAVGEDEAFVLSSDPITGTVQDVGSHGIYVTANDLAASGAEPVGSASYHFASPKDGRSRIKSDDAGCGTRL